MDNTQPQNELAHWMPEHWKAIDENTWKHTQGLSARILVTSGPNSAEFYAVPENHELTFEDAVKRFKHNTHSTNTPNNNTNTTDTDDTTDETQVVQLTLKTTHVALAALTVFIMNLVETQLHWSQTTIGQFCLIIGGIQVFKFLNHTCTPS